MDTQKAIIPRIVILGVWITTVVSIEQDVCLWNTFDAKCEENEVIQIEHAHYGRMSVGSCIPTTAGYEMGCQEDVLSYLDSVCSGRQSCQLRLLDYLATKDQPCQLGLTSFLQLQYSCISVHVSPKECTGDLQLVQGTRGLLANVITELTGQGSAECPWVVRGSPGQKIRLTLHDYAVWTAPPSEGADLKDESPRESTNRSITLCGGETREKIIYLSETESLQIGLTNPKHTRHAAYFLLQYEITGCPDFFPPVSAVVERRENEISVKCTATGSEWRLFCEGTQWTSTEEITNCTEAGGLSVSIGTVFNSALTLPQWILILMIITVAVIIAVPILVIGIVGLRRKHDPVTESHLQMDAGKYMLDSEHIVQERDPILAKSEILQTYIRGMEYTRAAYKHMDVGPDARPAGGEFPPLPPPPTASMPDAENAIVQGTLSPDRYPQDSCPGTFKPPHIEHKYESPIVIQRTQCDRNSTFYNELGPGHNHVQMPSSCGHAESDIEMLGLNPVESTVPE